MSLVAFTIKLERIDEELLYRDPGGGAWLSCVCSLDQDAKGRLIVTQSLPKERYAAGEKGPAIGTWRKIGASKPAQNGKGCDLSKYKKPPAPNQEPFAPRGTEEGPLFPSEEERAI